MREILFRGKKLDGKWVEGGFCYGGNRNESIICPKYDFSKEVIPETVGQYTGLTDKNGKKIFEGDILEVSTNHHYIGVAVERLGRFVVEFNEGCFMKRKICNGCGLFHFNLTDETKVIGNIHDNPELLKGGEGK